MKVYGRRGRRSFGGCLFDKADIEAGQLAFRVPPTDLHLLHSCIGWSPLEMGNELLKLAAFSFGNELHCSILPVHHPAHQTKVPGTVYGELPVANPLNKPRYDCVRSGTALLCTHLG